MNPAGSRVVLRPEQMHIYHLRRSGGHGVIDWLLAHHAGPKIHYNQALPAGAGAVLIPHGQTRQIGGDFGKSLFEIISFEDMPLDQVAASIPLPRQTILMLRDPFNTFASRLKRVRENRAANRPILTHINPQMWKQYAREFLAPRYLPHAVHLNFNRWYTSVDYRREIAEKLGWTFTDTGFGSSEGWVFSRGSSFCDADPRNLDLLNRWQVYQNDEEWLSYFDDEIRQLSEQIFNFVPKR